jgi:hypothetical protein
MAPEGFSGLELADELEMANGGGDLHNDAETDKGGSKPEGEAAVGLRAEVLGELHLSQKQAEPGHNEAKAHEGETGAEPGQVGALGGQEVAEV